MRSVGAAERRARLGRRHHLAPGHEAATVAGAAGSLVGFHATDPASVFLSAAARVPGSTPADVEVALYRDRTIGRILGMRRTMFTVPVELVPVVYGACTRGIAAKERRRLVAQLEEGGIAAEGDGDTWLRAAEVATLDALALRGEAVASELVADVPALAAKLSFGEGKPYEGEVGVSTRVLFLLSAAGLVARGRPRGSWISSQHRWIPMESWLAGGVAEMAEAEARPELVRRWLATYGPGTLADVGWWTGWGVGDTRRALAGVEVAHVDLDGTPGYVLAGDEEPVPAPEPWVALLPALDPAVMGWKGRDWYLGGYGPVLFDRNGNAGPTVWSDGRVVGGWTQRRDGTIAYRLLEDIGAEAEAALAARAETVAAFFGDVRMSPRFRTPLERDLTS